jgi:hypothetical protein
VDREKIHVCKKYDTSKLETCSVDTKEEAEDSGVNAKAASSKTKISCPTAQGILFELMLPVCPHVLQLMKVALF